ncbi:hypothetical protein QJS10_CPA08g00502 [Acorus calamus]|uniref:3'-5' exonuclease domain-containing protein n=1 Tax=Acorus calamus TaxID=4465 RepID=A0AAV9ECF9_ACOCL|nr:hypothetical protein QJS10_CPA08g00502 [Acorus calamus]
MIEYPTNVEFVLGDAAGLLSDDNNNTDDPTRFLVGFDVEWKSEIGHEDNPVTVLQLGVDQRCFIFQILRCDAIRNALFNFLSDLHRVQDPRERSEADIGLQCQGWEHNGDKDIVGRAGISEAGRTKAGEGYSDMEDAEPVERSIGKLG